MLQETLITFCFKIRHNFFKSSFFPSTIIEWNNLDPTLRNSKRFADFKKSILKFISNLIVIIIKVLDLLHGCA